jgi:hypothetical protein
MSSTTPPNSGPTSAFFIQSVISFAAAATAVGLAVVYMPVDPWIRAFLAVGMLYLVTSTFSLAKVVRDRQESTAVLTRVDQARLEKLLAEHDPFNSNA